MNFVGRIDYARFIEPVALRLLGEPNPRLSKPPRDVRFGNHGSMAVNYDDGTWFDHENKVGGGVLNLIQHKRGCDTSGAMDWLRCEGLLTDGCAGGAGAASAAKGTKLTTYDYVDENGVLLHQTVRHEPKRFRQRRPDPEKAGHWIWNLNGVRTVLYRLPDLLAAVANGDTIYIVEGEKDADNLRALGFTATTNPMGAGKWRSEYSELLRDANVVVISDNDQAGRNHVDQVATSLNCVAARVRTLDIRSIWPECAEKNDISDWIAAGGDADKLQKAVNGCIEDAPPWSPSIALDAEVVKIDDSNETDAEIKRLSKLTPIEYERERKGAAEKLGIDRVTVLDGVVKAARGENGDTKGQGRPLELPTIEPWPGPINGADLLNDICNAVKSYLVLPDGSAEALALWGVHTHAFECFTHSPRLAITSPEKQCGKTTTLDVLGELVARPLPTSNATTAAIFRTIEKAKPTLLIDEADTFLGENEELRGVLNSGHRRGGQIIRTVGDDHEPRQFSTWSPAAIAMIGRLPDTLEDRSVSIALRRRRPTEKVQQFRSDRAQDLKQLARKIARWCDDNRQNLAASDPNTGPLANRAADNWRPLLSIADLAGGRWPEHARAVAEAAETAKQDQSKRAMVLSDIRDIFAARPETDRMRSAEMAEALGTMENRPWSEWRNGKPMTPAGLARLLAPFGITPGTKREGEATFKGYLLSDFTEAFATYLPDQTVTPSQPNNDGHCDTLQSVTPKNDVTVSKCNKPNNDGHCDGVTVSTPRSPASGWIDL